MRLVFAISWLAVLLTAVEAASVKSEPAFKVPPPPNLDRFYSPPKDYTRRKNGELLKYRMVPTDLKFLKYDKAYQLMYKSEDSHGKPTYGVTTVIIPKKIANARHFVTYNYYEDASAIKCAPSYNLQTPDWDNDPMFMRFLNDGYVINMPDYEGPKSQFGAGIQAGKSTLDSVRAVLASQHITGVPRDAKTVMLGCSGGSIPTGWAAELQPSYAPDLAKSVVGASMCGVIANVTATILRVNDGIYSGVIASGIFGIEAAYPEFRTALDKYRLPKAKSLDVAGKECSFPVGQKFLFDDMFDYFKGGVKALYDPVISKVLNGVVMGKNTPHMPVFMYQGFQDEFTPIQVMDKLYNDYCRRGASISYSRSPNADHYTANLNGVESTMGFMSDALNGKKMRRGCKKVTADLDKTKSHNELWLAPVRKRSGH